MYIKFFFAITEVWPTNIILRSLELGAGGGISAKQPLTTFTLKRLFKSYMKTYSDESDHEERRESSEDEER